MNRKRLAAFLCLAAAVLLTGCSGSSPSAAENGSNTVSESGSQNEDVSSDLSTSEDSADEALLSLPLAEDGYDLNDCIVLGEYRGLKLERASVEVTDEEVDSYIASTMSLEEVTDPEAQALEGDTVNIAFEGSIDGETFEGGSSDSYDVSLGSGRMIEGFEDGIVGMKAGETRELDLVFPEDYQEESLQGQPVVFSVTLNSIRRVPELTDAWVKENTGGEFDTADTYRASVREQLLQYQESNAEYTMQQDAWNQIQETSEFLKLPRAYVEAAAEQYDTDAENAAAAYGMELSDYLEALDMTEESYQEQREWYGRSAAQSRLMLEALARAEEITEDSEEYRAEVAGLTETYGMDEEALVSAYGEDAVREYALMQAVLDRILDLAVITEA